MNTIIKTISIYWFACTVTMLAAITFLSLWPLEQLPSMPGTDKSHHLIAYAFLMLPAALRRPKHWKLCALFFIAYSGVIELIQRDGKVRMKINPEAATARQIKLSRQLLSVAEIVTD